MPLLRETGNERKSTFVRESKYLPNTKNQGEAWELLTSLASSSVDLVFLDPQYEKVGTVLKLDYPLAYTSDYQILRIMEQIERILKPSSFCLLWVNKTLLGNDRIPLWLLKTPLLKIVDFLVWYKKNTLGLGSGEGYNRGYYRARRFSS